jgi:hypothetical protein
MQFTIKTFIIMTLDIAALSKMILGIVTFSIILSKMTLIIILKRS